MLSFLSSHIGLVNRLRKIVDFNFIRQKEMIRTYAPDAHGIQVLDIGCGTGEFSSLYSEAEYTGVDIDPSNIVYANKYFSNKRFLVGDITSLKFSDNTFNIVIVVGVLHHISTVDVMAGLKEIKRVLVSNGRILIIEDTKSNLLFTRAMHALDQGVHIRTHKQWSDLLTQIFDIEHAHTFKNGVCFYSGFALKNKYDV